MTRRPPPHPRRTVRWRLALPALALTLLLTGSAGLPATAGGSPAMAAMLLTLGGDPAAGLTVAAREGQGAVDASVAAAVGPDAVGRLPDAAAGAADPPAAAPHAASVGPPASSSAAPGGADQGRSGAVQGGTAASAVRAWSRPLPGRPPVLRRYDPPASPYGPGHRGVDLGGAPGDPVLAAGAGVVVYAGPLAGRGVVSVEHAGGLRTTYEPLAVTVKRGAVLTRGAVLGRLLGGHAGCPWPACLHWGLRRDDTYLDPLSLLRRGPVRLLPLHEATRPGRPDP